MYPLKNNLQNISAYSKKHFKMKLRITLFKIMNGNCYFRYKKKRNNPIRNQHNFLQYLFLHTTPRIHKSNLYQGELVLFQFRQLMLPQIRHSIRLLRSINTISRYCHQNCYKSKFQKLFHSKIVLNSKYV